MLLLMMVTKIPTITFKKNNNNGFNKLASSSISTIHKRRTKTATSDNKANKLPNTKTPFPTLEIFSSYFPKSKVPFEIIWIKISQPAFHISQQDGQPIFNQGREVRKYK